MDKTEKKELLMKIAKESPTLVIDSLRVVDDHLIPSLAALLIIRQSNETQKAFENLVNVNLLVNGFLATYHKHIKKVGILDAKYQTLDIVNQSINEKIDSERYGFITDLFNKMLSDD